MTARADAVTARIDLARRALAAARAAETALVAASAAASTVAAAVTSGAHPATIEVSLVAALAAGCAAVAYWLDRRPRPERVASTIDHRLGLGGALTTAYEAERRRPDRPLVQALSAGVARRVAPREAVRVALPASLPLLALPFLAAGWLALALDTARRPPPSLERLAERAAAALAGPLTAGQAGEAAPLESLEPSERAQLEALVRRIGALASAAREGRPDAARLAGDLAAKLEELRESLPVTPQLARALEQAGADLAAAREVLGRAEEPTAARGPGGGDRAHKVEGGGNAGSDGVPAGGRDGMMSGLEPGPARPPRPSVRAAGDDAALVLGPAPPERYAKIVAAWLEQRRGAADAAGR